MAVARPKPHSTGRRRDRPLLPLCDRARGVPADAVGCRWARPGARRRTVFRCLVVDVGRYRIDRETTPSSRKKASDRGYVTARKSGKPRSIDNCLQILDLSGWRRGRGQTKGRPRADRGHDRGHPKEEGRRKKEEGRRKKEEGRRKKEEGRRKKEEGRRKKEEGRRKKEEGRRKKEEGRRKKEEGRRKNKRAATAADVELPAELATPEFRKAWSEWLLFRSSNGWPRKAPWARKQLTMLAKFGAAIAVRALQGSMEQNYRGVFPERFAGAPQPRSMPMPAQRRRERMAQR